MSVLESEIAKAMRRADFDVAACASAVSQRLPRDLADDAERRARWAFLAASLGRDKAEVAFERVLQGNELQPISYLERGAIAARAIARINVRSSAGVTEAWGTGFLIAPNVLITNNHVFGNANSARPSLAQFSYELDLGDRPVDPVSFALEPEQLFYTHSELDFTVVAVRDRSQDGMHRLSRFGHLPLLVSPGKAFEGEWLTIVQHPSGERKQLCVRENRLLKRATDVLWYSTDTLPGSSGSPVFNNDWYVVALHHSGVPETKGGRRQSIDGRDFDPTTMDDSQLKYVANEGIRASRIVETLQTALPQHALLRPLYAATPASARIVTYPGTTGMSPVPIPHPEHRVMATTKTITIPVEVTLELGPDGVGTSLIAATAVTAEAAVEAAKKKRAPAFDAPFEDDYSKRKGFQAAFLGTGAKRVALPQLSADLNNVAAPLLANPNVHVLDYHNFSVVMHTERRFAIYSAANLSVAKRYDMSRPPDVWRRDPRISAKHQIENWYYAANQFDRGHLTRREDLEYGDTPVKALQSAADTCHWTNCTPQHAEFNQNREIWQGIERYLLEETILDDNVNAQVITGPVLDEGDPEYRDIRYPVQYWKVVAALDSNKELFATAYIASQADVIARFGIEAAQPFGPYKTYQVRIAEVERLTGLTFVGGANDATLLRTLDPLAKQQPRRRTVRAHGPSEALMARVGAAYYELGEFEDIVLPR